MRISGCIDKASFEIPTCTEKAASLFFSQQSNVVMVLQEQHITISSGSTMHLHFGYISFCFNVSRMYPVTSLWLESVRFSVSKHIFCQTIAVDVSVVFSSRVFIYFDTRKSVKENKCCKFCNEAQHFSFLFVFCFTWVLTFVKHNIQL